MATFVALGGLASGQEAAPAKSLAAALTQRASDGEPSVTLLEVVGALAAADRSEKLVSTEEVKRLEKYIRTAPDDIRPRVAEETLRLKQPWLWSRMVARAFSEWAVTDGAAAMRRVETIQDESRKETAFYATCDIWMLRQPEQYCAWLLKCPDEVERERLLRNFIEWRASNDISEAVRLLPHLKYPAMREHAMTAISWKWGEKDPQAALRWVNSLGSVNHGLIRNVVLGQASKNKEAGVALAMSLPDAAMRSDVVNDVHQMWSEYDLRAAMKSFLKLPAALQYAETGNSFGSKTGKMAVQQILELAQELPPIKEVRVRFLASAASCKRSDSQMQDSLALLEKLEAGPERTEGVYELALYWSRADLGTASAWIERMPEGEEKQVAVKGVARGVVCLDPLRAFAWTEKLVDGKVAAVLREELYFDWWRADKKVARPWLEQTKYFNAKEKTEMLEKMELLTQMFGL
jgi:hypothetical protein